MTFARTALRLAVVQAVAGTEGERPTIAAGRVYDSRMAPENPEEFLEDAKPLVIVMTDGDDGDALSDQNGGPPFARMIDLVLDLGMVAGEKAEGDEGGYLVGYPDTDARLEASLDLLQAQIARHLFKSTAPLALFIQNHVRVWSQESHRQTEDGAAVKLARRLWTLKCQIKDDDDEIRDPEGLFDLLPEPLRSVAMLMPEGSAGYDTCAALAQAFGALDEDSVPFEGMNFTLDPAKSGAFDADDDRQVHGSADTGQ